MGKWPHQDIRSADFEGVRNRLKERTMSEHEVNAIVAAAYAAAGPVDVQVDDKLAVLRHIVPIGYETRDFDVEPYQQNPRRPRGTVHVSTVDDLVAYLERFGDERTTVWVHPTSGRVEAVLDDHHPALNAEVDDDGALQVPHIPEIAGHGDHRAVLDLIVTPEWDVWTTNDSRSFNQTEFAEHIEENAKEIVAPTAAEMLELAQNFHAISSATFRSSKRLDNGQTQLQYDEEVTATGGKSGQLTVPQAFELAISPFVGEPLYKVTARFRYRIPGGKLSLAYLLDRPDDIVRDALADVQKRLRDKFSNTYLGTPRTQS